MPDYRMWGSRDPRGRVKPPIVALVPEPSVDDDGAAVLRLYDPIDSWGDFWGVSAREFLEALDSVGNVDRIRLHLNSPGGEVYEAIAILNALRRHPAEVTAVVDGIAASAASFIAAGVDRLVMAPNTELMIHDAWGIGIGPAADMRELADRLDQVSDNIAGIYAAKAGTPAAEWRERMLAETWIGPDAAVELGLADGVEGVVPDDEGAVAARFDLGIFRARTPEPAPVVEAPAAAVVVDPDAGFTGEPEHDAEIAASLQAAERRRRYAQRRHEQNARRAS